jgi:hypothetical protein
VTSIDGRPVGSGKVGAITKRMLEEFRRKALELTSGAATPR